MLLRNKWGQVPKGKGERLSMSRKEPAIQHAKGMEMEGPNIQGPAIPLRNILQKPRNVVSHLSICPFKKRPGGYPTFTNSMFRPGSAHTCI